MAIIPASQAGQVRRIELSEDRPATVILALGRSTAISFLSRPEKVVPGSPQAIQINFVGSDLTVTPVSRRPGNLLVYSKSGRYVILFATGSDTHYDDVVRIGTVGRGRPLRLLTDSFHLASFKVTAISKDGKLIDCVPNEIVAQLVTHEREMSGPDLDDLLDIINGASACVSTGGSKSPLRCTGCMVRTASGSARISCLKPIETLHCESKAVSVELERRTP